MYNYTEIDPCCSQSSVSISNLFAVFSAIWQHKMVQYWNLMHLYIICKCAFSQVKFLIMMSLKYLPWAISSYVFWLTILSTIFADVSTREISSFCGQEWLVYCFWNLAKFKRYDLLIFLIQFCCVPLAKPRH